jgi:hypothetical protein
MRTLYRDRRCTRWNSAGTLEYLVLIHQGLQAALVHEDGSLELVFSDRYRHRMQLR